MNATHQAYLTPEQKALSPPRARANHAGAGAFKQAPIASRPMRRLPAGVNASASSGAGEPVTGAHERVVGSNKKSPRKLVRPLPTNKDASAAEDQKT